MTKFVKKSSAVAVAAGLALFGFANAAVTNVITPVVDLDDDSAGVVTFAKELSMTNASPLVTGVTNFQAKLGFGVSNAQTRYIRVDYTNAVLDAAHIAADVEMQAADPSFTVAVVQGGAVADSYVIYQITAGDDYSATDLVDFKVPDLRVTDTANSVQVTYSLHETAVSAIAGAAGAGKLYSKTGEVAKFTKGLKFAVTTVGSPEADVEDQFKSFVTDGATTTLGTITYGVNTAETRDGTTNLAIADLVTTANLIVKGDFSAFDEVWLDGTGNDCAASGGGADIDLALNTAKTEAVGEIDANAVATTKICGTVNGTSAVAAQTLTAELDVLTKPTDAATADEAAVTLGNITRNGATLVAPYATTFGSFVSKFYLTNTSTAAAAVVAQVYTDNGNVCTTGTSYTAANPGSIPAGKTLEIDAKDLCSGFTGDGKQRYSVVFTVAAPTASVHGNYRIVDPVSLIPSLVTLSKAD